MRTLKYWECVLLDETHIIIFVNFLGRVKLSTLYVGHYLAHCTSPGWQMMSVRAFGGMRIGRGN
jgi:hypothetical protein